MRVKLFICLSGLVMAGTGFMILPILPIIFRDDLRLSTGEIGAVLGVGTAIHRFLPALVGPLVDRGGTYRALAIAWLARCAGFSLLLFGDNFAQAVGGFGLVGLGGAIYEPALRGYATNLPDDERARIFSALNYYLNVGVVGGPIVGIALERIGVKAPLVLAAALMASGMIATIVHRDIFATSKPDVRGLRVTDMLLPFRVPEFISLFAMSVLSAFMLAQVFFFIPMYAERLTQHLDAANIALSAAAFSSIAFVLACQKRLERADDYRALAAGCLLLGSSLVALPLGGSLAWILACAAIFGMGESIVLIKSDVAVSKLASEGRAATFFGSFELSYALGATAGTAISPVMAIHGETSGLPWAIFAACAVVATAGFVLIGRQRYARSAFNPVLHPEPRRIDAHEDLRPVARQPDSGS